MKKLLTTSIFVLFTLALAFNISSAQTSASKSATIKATLVATVNVYNATNTKVSDGTYKISFDLNNRQGIQSDIRYGIELVEKSSGKVVDTYLANEALTLTEGESKNISMTYSIPSFISNGDYELLIVSETSEGTLLSSSPAGFPEKIITISNNESYPTISSCSSDNTRNTVNPEENINITCNFSLPKSNQGNLKIGYVVHKNTIFGDILAQGSVNNISVKDGGSSSFTITSASNAGQYLVDIFLENSSGYKISPSYDFSYFVNGNNVTIQNIVLDKSNYKKGDTANLKIFLISPPQNINKYTLNVKISDSGNNLCGTSTKNITGILPGFVDTSLAIPITKDCTPTSLVVEITDSEGNILASSNTNPGSTVNDININPGIKNIGDNTLSGINKNYVVVFIIILVLVGYGILTLRKGNKKK